jgi:pimeloyl-ACP methyl ester carboxylesterase
MGDPAAVDLSSDQGREPRPCDRATKGVAFTKESVIVARAIEHGLHARTWSSEDYDLIPEVRSLPIPTLVIYGDNDLVPIEVARHIATAIPESRLVVLDCGHFCSMEQPDLVGSNIAESLA